jgi:23S rRNA pseudouridine1911/1915/1917 synthase
VGSLTRSVTESPPPIKILYEDNHLLAVEKPVNIPSQSDESGDPDLLSLLKQDLKIRYAKPGNVYLGLIHRLDRPAGGAMVFAKTSKAAARLSEAVRSRQFKKTYVAVVHGIPAPKSGRLTHHLLKRTREKRVYVVPPDTPRAKEAVLDYRVLEHSDRLSLVEIDLQTGRTHQIRVQMAAIGCPLYGDQKYGALLNRPGQQLALWSVEIAFRHPTTRQNIVIRSKPPTVYPWTEWSCFSIGSDS